MIRAGITGATTREAGEIIKLLINHPDVEIMWALDADAEGALLSDFHPGLRGETYLPFTARPSDDVDVIFLCSDESGVSRAFLEKGNFPESTRIIDLSGDMLPQSSFADGDEWIFGLPELCRKPLVRGASKTAIPDALTSAVLLAVTPFAKEQWLTGSVSVSAVVAELNAGPGEALALLDLEQADDIARAVRSLQPDFKASQLKFMVINGGWRQGISIAVHFPTTHSEAEAIEAFNSYYDDHNFTFLSAQMPNLNEVLGTNKCIINIQKIEDELVITAVIDDLLKGRSAMAVHDMNLLFGLQERVGLMLKSQA